ncbi:MAG: hypothetical protein F9K39_12160 [Exiguobacterium chiriqhucha]|uniref:hypothetical protein n=1 Tax=Exiguobacterium chiriqhucha TaxID=1385984 RepID=UPI00144E2083|nr:hypothetical protein [Exiguobacterium chiriqhucha]KAB2861890.1 MAG: hypothetical protein F9K39_12160 [Exiguobacterium chiriqhucha]
MERRNPNIVRDATDEAGDPAVDDAEAVAGVEPEPGVLGDIVLCPAFARTQAATAGLVAVALWTSTAQLLANERMLWREDTRYAAARWIVENIPEGARVVVEDPGGYGPVVDPTRYEIGLHNFRPEDDVTSLAEAYEKGYEYFVASALMYQLNPQLDTENLYRDLETDPRVVPVMVFPGMSLEDNFHHPEIKIYRLYEAAPERIAPITHFFPQDGRYGWLFHLDGPWKPDSEEAPTRSLLMLYEDDHPLGPPHSKHDDIRERGGGRYSHWEEWILFSTSDNTDPNRNGRKYWVRSLE